MDILERRKGSGASKKLPAVGAVGLIQGKVVEMICAADVAEKTAEVLVEDIRGNCPQSLTTLAVFGELSAVEAALEAIRQRAAEGGQSW